MGPTLTAAERDFYTGLGLGLQWADTVPDAATRERFLDAAVIHGLQAPHAGDAGRLAIVLAASILGVACDDDAAGAFWAMAAPGLGEGDLTPWFFHGFIAGAAEAFSGGSDDEFGELRRLVRDPSHDN